MPLTGSEKRLKDIQDALAGIVPPSQSMISGSSRPTPLASQVNSNKRHSDSDELAPPAKRRLPSSWQDKDMDRNVVVPSKQAIAARVQTVTTTTKTVTASSSSSTSATAKPAKVFLSSEQNQILKLVSDGHSVFYTGSAGAFFFLFFLIIPNLYTRI